MRRLLNAALVLLLALALAPAALAGQVRGVSDSEIRIGQWGPQTGPAALWGAVARGTGLLVKMINAQGGINGRKIKYYIRDDAYQPSRTKAVVKELVERQGVFMFVGGVGTSPGLAVMDYLVKKNVPWGGMATGSTHWAFPPKRTVFAVYPNYPDEAQILVRYAVKTLGKKRVAFFYQNDDYGKGGLVGAVKELKALGMKLVAEVPVEVGEVDLASHALKMKAAGADCVVLWVLPKHAAIIVGTAAKMGYRPQWISSSTLSDAPLMFKITKGLWRGVVYGNFAELPDSKHPLMVKYRAAWKKYAPKERWGTFYLAGIGFAEPMFEGLKRAGRNLTVDSFVAAMEKMKGFKGIMGKISFGPGQRQGLTQVFLAKCVPAKAKVKGRTITYGKGVRLSGWIGVR